jgi:hypothetical protein
MPGHAIFEFFDLRAVNERTAFNDALQGCLKLRLQRVELATEIYKRDIHSFSPGRIIAPDPEYTSQA